LWESAQGGRLTTKKPMAKKAKKAVAPKAAAEQKNQSSSEFDKFKVYSLEEAIEFTKKLSKTKFDASVEMHLRLGIDPRKGDQQIRTAVSLPHGTGKSVRVAAFVSPDKEKEVRGAGADIVGGEELIAEIKSTEKTDFQVAVAEPAMMKNLAQIAKILGTRGLMPSPKNETVTPNPAKAVMELKKGKVSFKNDDTGNIHVLIGKVSFDNAKLTENFDTIVNTIKKVKPAKSKGVYIKNISISSSMGPGVKVAIPK
jgi:large subunit ribosomal protein L1